MTQAGWSETIEVAVADASPAAATVLIRTDLPPEQLDGQLSGPYCRLSHTLPVATPLSKTAGPAGWSARVDLIDPCFWSPQMPAYYRLRLRCKQAGQGTEGVERPVGIRHLAARRQSLYLEGRRWVVRGAWAGMTDWCDFAAWRQQRLCRISRGWEPGLWQQASEVGLGVIADLRWSDAGDLAGLLRRLWTWPAVFAVVVPADHPAGGHIRHWAPNLIVAAASPPSPVLPPRPAWADLQLVHARLLGGLAPAQAPRHPLWAVGPRTAELDATDVRRDCERLQARLAPQWDLAGYLVDV